MHSQGDGSDHSVLLPDGEHVRLAVIERWLLAVLAVLTIVVGGVRATRHSLWLDEAATGAFMRCDFRGLLSLLWREGGMAPYYAGLWIWTRFGSSDWWLRMFSVVGAAAAVVGAYLLARRLAGRAAALVSSLAILANPMFQMRWSDARAYTWQVAVACFSLLAYLRFVRNPTRRSAALSSIANGITLTISVFALPLVALQWIWSARLFGERHTRRLAIAWSTGSLVILLPFLHAIATSGQTDWIEPLTLARFHTHAVHAFGGTWWFAALAAGNALLVVSVLARGRGSLQSRGRLLLAAIALCAPLSLAALSLVKPSFVSRYLMYALAPAIIGAVIGYGVLLSAAQRARRPVARCATLAIGALVFVGALLFPYGTFGSYLPEQDLRSAAVLLREPADTNEYRVFVPVSLATRIVYYTRKPVTAVLPDRAAVDALAPGARVWVWRIGDTSNDAQRRLEERGSVLSRIDFNGITVYEVVIADER